MKIDIWSDVVCPWCYIGKRHIELALERFPHAADVEIEWHSYELDPDGPREREGTYLTRLARKYHTTVDEARARIAQIVEKGAAVGLQLDFERLRAGNTFDAHRLLHLAKQLGVQHELKERLFRATFAEGEPVGDPATLTRLAVDAGLDRGAVEALLAGDDYADDVRADEARAADLGVHGVPFFLFEETYGLAGAHPPEAFARVLNRVWQERA